MRLNGTTYVKAQADTESDAEAIGIVSAVAGLDDFTVQVGGHITGLTGLTGGNVYYVAGSTAGLLTTNEPATAGQVSKPLLVADGTSSGWIFNWRGQVLAGSGSGAPVTSSFEIDLRNPQQSSNAGNAFPSVATLTAYENMHWEFLKDVAGKVYGLVRIPENLADTPNADIVLEIGANATSGVTRLNVKTKDPADGESMNPAALVAETSQDITVPGTARLRKKVTFTLTNPPAAGDLLIVEVEHEGNHTNDTLAVNTELYGAWLICDVN